MTQNYSRILKIIQANKMSQNYSATNKIIETVCLKIVQEDTKSLKKIIQN